MSPLGPFLMPAGLDPVDSIAHLSDQPYLIIHGNNDHIVNPRHSKLLYQAAQQSNIPVTLYAYPADHNSLLQTTPQARQNLIDFFKANLTKQ